MARAFSKFIGIDLGGSRGKTTVVSRLRWEGGAHPVWVDRVSTRAEDGQPYCDQALFDELPTASADTVIAVNAPLTGPPCARCTEPVCPGYEACTVTEVVWLRESGEQLVRDAMAADRDRVAAIGASSPSGPPPPRPHRRLAPYLHRATEVHLHYSQRLVPRDCLGKAAGPIAARAAHVARVLGSRGFELNRNLIEVMPRATVAALFGKKRARGYKRDADPWTTRAAIVEGLADELRFAPHSRMAREDVLRNDHCFDALISAYTAYRWSREGWTVPDEMAETASGGWVWTPEHA